MQVSQRGRFTERVFPYGEDPDPHFTLANERTFPRLNATAGSSKAGS